MSKQSRIVRKFERMTGIYNARQQNEYHLPINYFKMKDKISNEGMNAVSDIIMEVAIGKAIEDERDLLKPSIQHFLGGGNVNGQFLIALKKLYKWVERKTIEAIGEKRGWRPKIVCLCGSTRFIDAFQSANLKLTCEGIIVLSVGCNTKSDTDLLHSGELTEELKIKLDDLHKRKIDLADEILVLNVGGYIGESTRGEINYATEMGKPVSYLESGQAIDKRTLTQ